MAVITHTVLDVSAFAPVSGFKRWKPRRPARVEVSSIDARIVSGSRKRSAEILNGYKVHYHGSDFRIFFGLSGI